MKKPNKTPKLKFVYIPIILTLLFGSAMIGLTDYIMQDSHLKIYLLHLFG